jgi:hypothetical protein
LARVQFRAWTARRNERPNDLERQAHPVLSIRRLPSRQVFIVPCTGVSAVASLRRISGRALIAHLRIDVVKAITQLVKTLKNAI